MKRFTFILCIILLLLIVAEPVNAASPTISAISPNVGYTNGKVQTFTITGTAFNDTEGDVILRKSGEDDIDSYDILSWSSTEIECKFRILSSIDTGKWNLVVVRGDDDTEAVKSNAFTITSPMTLTSISPTHAQVNNDSVKYTIIGTGLSDVTDVFLYNNDYDNISATDVVPISATKVEGTFDLTGTDEDTYDVCVVNDYGTEECDLSFEITTDEVGSIDISSSPSGASIYVDGSLKGTTPDTVDDLVEGSYKVVLKKSGYNDWGKVVKVTAGDTNTIDADLVVISTATPAPTATPTTRPTTVRTTAKSTVKVPTTWPSSTPTTAASPLDPVVIIGTIGLAFIALRKR